MSSFIPRNLTEIEAITGCTFACICNTVFRMFSCLQINCQPFYLRQLLKFHQFDWLIEIYLQTEGQGTHQKMVIAPTNVWFFPSVNHTKTICSKCDGFSEKLAENHHFTQKPHDGLSKVLVLKAELLKNQQKTINKPSIIRFDVFFPVSSL